jgi:hypothetical protein
MDNRDSSVSIVFRLRTGQREIGIRLSTGAEIVLFSATKGLVPPKQQQNGLKTSENKDVL